MDVELHLLTFNPYVPFYQVIVRDGITFHVIKNGVPGMPKGYPYYFPFDALTGYFFETRNVLKIIEDISPQIIHVQGTESAFGNIALKQKSPFIVSIQGIITEYFQTNPSLFFRIQKKHEQNLVRKAKYFGCRTDWDKEFVSGLNAKAEIFHLNEAVNPLFFESQWRDTGGYRLVFVGSLIQRKGVEELLDSVGILKKRFPDISLRMIGGHAGPSYMKLLRSKCEEMHIANSVSFLGVRTPKEIKEILLESHVFVLPTYNDNSPNSLAEAMVLGMPVVASGVGGIPSIVEDGVNGMLCEQKNAEHLANVITRLLNNRALMAELGVNARRVAVARHEPKLVAQTTMDAYRKILDIEGGHKTVQ
jgi:glycosyltransferase involved in cell wall biosynthesis